MKENKFEHLANFSKMPAWAQAEVLEREGTELARRLHKGWEVRLFSIDNYYVELWEKQELKITTTFRNSAKALAVLEPYLGGIAVQDLVGF
ncbi:hypothetical protein [Botryobacter ruber]|uniref:hypothetical protein n=1 Tax=Botryobacter ruber TaxID=2171629 RepID=UPI000E0CB357|nr:hypothetical protein [Botryobacter ruber]